MRTGKCILKKLEFGPSRGEVSFGNRTHILPISCDTLIIPSAHIEKPYGWFLRNSMMWNNDVLSILRILVERIQNENW